MKVLKLGILLSAGFLLFLSCGEEERAYGPEEVPVGVVTYILHDESRQKDITTEIWYPAMADPGASGWEYEGGSQGIAVREAIPEPKYAPYPLVVFSHGFGGIRDQSVFLTESLASRGFVVVAPDHRDAGILLGGGFGGDGLEIDAELFIDRPQDISFLIDEVLARSTGDDAVLQGLVDESRIGVTGHSLGGYTSIAVAGADSDLEDQRVMASLPLAPVSSLFGPEGISQIDIPMMVVGGTKDTICPFDTEQEALYQALNPPKYLLEIFEAGHLVFSEVACAFLPDAQECLRADELQGIIASYTTAFFCFYLRDDKSFSSELQQKTTDDFEFLAERE